DARLNHLATGESNQHKLPIWEKCIDKRLTHSFRNKIMKSSYYQNIIRKKTKENLELTFEIDNRNIKNIIKPIFSNQITYGFITLMDVNNSITEIDIISLKHVA